VRTFGLVWAATLAFAVGCESPPATQFVGGGWPVERLPSLAQLSPEPLLRAPLSTLRPFAVDLRVDANRNGVVDENDLDEDRLETAPGAVFFANIDDDQGSCRAAARSAPDRTIDQCNDAADEVINGAEDLDDLAKVLVKGDPTVSEGVTARLTITAGAAKVRLFRPAGAGYVVAPSPVMLTTAELRSGLTFLLEGRDVVRDRQAWDGAVELRLEAQSAVDPALTAVDVVRLTVAPVVLFHHLLPATSVFVSAVPRDTDSVAFVAALRGAVSAFSSQVPVVTVSTDDQWNQDYFETGYMAVPGPGGSQRVMTVFLRSANVDTPSNANFPMRSAGRSVFTQFRGRDVAGVQQVDLRHDPEMDTLNSFGNWETIPPYTLNGRSYPLGRNYRGSIASYSPDQTFKRLIDAQGVQPAVEVDTSWLLVGHVDETVSFLKVNSPRGWVVLANDARLARRMLQEAAAAGASATPMFDGKFVYDDRDREVSARRTIAQVLADPDVAASSDEAAVKVDQQLAVLKRETGLTDQEIIGVPFLHEPVSGGSLAYNPGTVNMLVLDERNVVVPDPFGPVVNGRDIFKAQLEAALARYQVRIHWVDDWNLYHRLAGEVHCGTNTVRSVPSMKWWEAR
jgi:protein-arginine deiminase